MAGDGGSRSWFRSLDKGFIHDHEIYHHFFNLIGNTKIPMDGGLRELELKWLWHLCC